MSLYTAYNWVEGVTQVGPTRMNAIEAALADASGHHGWGTLAARPAASAANRGWYYYANDINVLYQNVDGTIWLRLLGDYPLGTIAMLGIAGPTDAGLICDGSAVSRSTYADLFAVMSTTFGAGNGSTTFNIPDLRGRVPVGRGTGSGLTLRSLGGTGGEETHVLTYGELAKHTHSIDAKGSAGTDGGGAVRGIASSTTYTDAGTAKLGGSGGAFPPGDQAHNNMQPWLGVTYQIQAF